MIRNSYEKIYKHLIILAEYADGENVTEIFSNLSDVANDIYQVSIYDWKGIKLAKADIEIVKKGKVYIKNGYYYINDNKKAFFMTDCFPTKEKALDRLIYDFIRKGIDVMINLGRW